MNAIISIPIILIFLFLLVVLSFLLSAAETSIIGLSKIRLRHMVSQGVKHSQTIQRLVLKLDKVIVAILIGNNFVNIAISAIVTALFVQIFGYHWGVVLSTFSLTLFVLIFCEITPKILATKRTEKVALFSAPFMEGLISFLTPFIFILMRVSNIILKLFKVGPTKRSLLITEEELRMMIDIGQEEGILSSEEKKMLHRIFEFADTKVSEVMIAADKMVCVNANASSDELLDIFVEKGHARLPVYRDSPDNVIGIIYARDLLYILRDKGLFVLHDLVNEACYIPADMPVSEILRKFQAEKIQIAIVTDKRKRALGLVTLEDLLEEIVGEIEEDTHRHSLHKA
ncbi:MAG: hemolysin family protein [Candidatus Omnitrophica bacterium]|nr:hemolysin family protein [Candidatus Omnitrophota bacterium]